MKKLICIVIACLIMLSSMVCVNAEMIYLFDDWSLKKAERFSDEYAINSYIGNADTVTFPQAYGGCAISEVAPYAFNENALIKSVTFNQQITMIDIGAFLNASVLTNVTLNSSIDEIRTSAFSGTSSLKYLNLEDTKIKEVASYAFLNSGIEEITLPDTCTRIADYAFTQCYSLVKISIPASVTEISETAFNTTENVVIYAPYGSYAIDYAVAHGIECGYSDLEEYSFLRGDADDDGEVSIIDATRIQRILVHLNEDTDGKVAIRAAFDYEDGLTILDATRIQRYIAYFSDPYGIGETSTVYFAPDGTVIRPPAITTTNE